MKLFKQKAIKKTVGYVLISFLLLGFAQVSLAKDTFVKRIKVKGNTLIDPQTLKDHFELGNGLKMNPFIMDLAASELRSVYRFHGHPDIDSYALNNKGTIILKVHEKREYQYGAARAELAVYNLDWNFNMKTTEEQKKEAIRKLVKGYKKIKLNHEIVTSFLVKNQRARIEDIQAEKNKAMREKVALAVKDFKERNLAAEKEEARRIEEMRKRVEAAAKRKEMEGMEPKIVEYGEITPFERSAF